MSTRKKFQKIIKLFKTFSKPVQFMSGWKIYFGVICIVFCFEIGTLILQSKHSSNIKQPAHAQLTVKTPVNSFRLQPTTQVAPSSKPAVSSITGAKQGTSIASTPSIVTPTYNPCDDGPSNDTTARATLANSYLEIDDYITSHVDSDANAVETNPTDSMVETNALFDLNSVISEANSQYTQSYNEYISQRQEYNCSITVSAPTAIPTCAGRVADCIASINTNLPAEPTW